MAYQFDFGAVFDYSGLLAQGAGFTLALTAAGAVLGGAQSARMGVQERDEVVTRCLRGRGYRVLN